MISTSDLAQILLDHHGANPEDAALCAGLIIDHRDASVERPLAELISVAKSAYPMLFKREEPAAKSGPTPSTLSITQRIAIAARGGESVSEAEIRAAFDKARGL